MRTLSLPNIYQVPGKPGLPIGQDKPLVNNPEAIEIKDAASDLGSLQNPSSVHWQGNQSERDFQDYKNVPR